METVELVIKIPKEDYEYVKEVVQKEKYVVSKFYYNIANGTPLPKGHWVGTDYDGYADGNPVYDAYECSECGAEFYGEDFDFDYCPRCGAKIEEVE